MLITYPFSLIIHAIYLHGVMQRDLKLDTIALVYQAKIRKCQSVPNSLQTTFSFALKESPFLSIICRNDKYSNFLNC